MTVRVLVVDDHPLVRAGFLFLAEARPEIEVVGEADGVATAVASAAALRPDVVVMDIALRDGSGIDAAARIRRENPTVKVLFVTMRDDDATVLEALRAGASGYVVKGAHQDDIVRAILGAAAGDLVLDPRASEAVTQRLEGLHVAHEPFPQLTAREREVLDLMAAGLPNAAIARRIGITSKTVANHAANITLKLPARDRSHAVIIARDAGLGRNVDDA